MPDDLRGVSAATGAEQPSGTAAGGYGFAAAGGLIGAIGASACCVLPLLLAVLGLGGAWMSALRSLAPYQPYFVALAIGAIGYGLYRTYRARPAGSGEGGPRRASVPGGLARAALWISGAIVLVTVTFPYWLPLAEPYLP